MTITIEVPGTPTKKLIFETILGATGLKPITIEYLGPKFNHQTPIYEVSLPSDQTQDNMIKSKITELGYVILDHTPSPPSLLINKSALRHE